MLKCSPFMHVYALTKFALGQIVRKVMIGFTHPVCFFEAMVIDCISISIGDIQKQNRLAFKQSPCISSTDLTPKAEGFI